MLRGQGNHDQADQQLPDQVDTDNVDHAGMLSKFGLDADMLKGTLGGLRGQLK